jgi:tetratricopeptide (TPR) repeat protein/AAA+ ATPase superfamily predicted ATPase
LKAVHLTEPHFSGRDQELKTLLNHLELAFQGKGTTVFILGEAGAGKTRLANEFLTLAKGRGVEIISGYCLGRAAVPYFPFIEAFNAYFASEDQSKGKRVASDRSGIIGWLKGTESIEAEQLGIKAWLTGPRQARKLETSRTLSPEIRKNMTHAAVTEALTSKSAEKPIVLFIDDLQWADSASLSMIHYISRAIVSSRVLIIGTFRSEELAPDSEGHPHPLVETLRLMSREDLHIEIRLSCLSEPEVAQLAESMMSGSVDRDLIEKLAKESQGNPLFAVESLRLLSESGNLVQENDKWRLSGDKVGIPNKVKDVILRRLDFLNSTQRRILDLASVAGEKFDPTMLAAALSMDKILVHENLHQMSHSTLLVNPADSVYRFGHAKFREVLYEELSPPLKKEYHARVGETIEKDAQTKEVPVNELAFHYLQAGNKEKSVKYALLSGEDARKRFSNTETIDYFSYVLNTVSDDLGYAGERIIALEGLGDAYYAVGLFEKAKVMFEKIIETADTGAVRLRALRKAMAASFYRGDMTYTIELANRAEKDAAFDRLDYARIGVFKAHAIGSRGKVEEAIRDLENCLQVFQEENSVLDIAVASRAISEYYSCECRTEEALNAVHRSIEIYTNLKDPYEQAEAHFYEGHIYFNCGRNQEALDSYGKTIEIGGKIGEYNFMAWSSLYCGLVHESLGEVKEALTYSLKAVEYAEKTDSYYVQSMSYANVTRDYAKLGDVEHMKDYYNKFTKLFILVSRTASRLAHAVGVRTEALFFAAQGQWSEANKHFEECLDLYKGAVFARLNEAMARTDYALVLARQGKATAAKTQVEEASRLYSTIGNNAQIASLTQLLDNFKKNS